MRFFIAMVSHGTKTFSTIATDRGQLELRGCRDVGEFLAVDRDTRTCRVGMIANVRRASTFNPNPGDLSRPGPPVGSP